MKKLGVIGGLGPMATALYMQMMIEMTEAETDQQHIEMIVYNCPQIPDRTGYILGKSKSSPVTKMIEIGKKLVDEGAELITFPCVTANYFYPELSQGIGAPILNIVDEACSYFKEHQIKNIGLLATSGTVASGIFQDAFARAELNLILPDEEGQRDIMCVIYDNVKANQPVDMGRFHGVAEQLQGNGAEIIILGCTELSVVQENYNIGAGYLDLMRLMARNAVQYCGTLKQEYTGSLTEG